MFKKGGLFGKGGVLDQVARELDKSLATDGVKPSALISSNTAKREEAVNKLVKPVEEILAGVVGKTADKIKPLSSVSSIPEQEKEIKEEKQLVTQISSPIAVDGAVTSDFTISIDSTKKQEVSVVDQVNFNIEESSDLIVETAEAKTEVEPQVLSTEQGTKIDIILARDSWKATPQTPQFAGLHVVLTLNEVGDVISFNTYMNEITELSGSVPEFISESI